VNNYWTFFLFYDMLLKFGFFSKLRTEIAAKHDRLRLFWLHPVYTAFSRQWRVGDYECYLCW